MSWFHGDTLVYCAAPMVRFSRLPFRSLVRHYGCDVAYTPMIMADSFASSADARQNEFVTNENDRPLIVQFAASDDVCLVSAAEHVVLRSDGIDINCGCPQRWALQEGIGASLLSKPELIHDMVLALRRTISDSNFSISIKIRIEKDERRTVGLCQNVEQAGVSFIAVHGRRIDQRHESVNTAVIKLVKESVSVPVVANGDIFCLEDAEKVRLETGVDGVMSARGLLRNPALFSGCTVTPASCVKTWVETAAKLGCNQIMFHRHLIEMMHQLLPRSQRKLFNGLPSMCTDKIEQFVAQYLEAS